MDYRIVSSRVKLPEELKPNRRILGEKARHVVRMAGGIVLLPASAALLAGALDSLTSPHAAPVPKAPSSATAQPTAHDVAQYAPKLLHAVDGYTQVFDRQHPSKPDAADAFAKTRASVLVTIADGQTAAARGEAARGMADLQAAAKSAQHLYDAAESAEHPDLSPKVWAAIGFGIGLPADLIGLPLAVQFAKLAELAGNLGARAGLAKGKRYQLPEDMAQTLLAQLSESDRAAATTQKNVAHFSQTTDGSWSATLPGGVVARYRASRGELKRGDAPSAEALEKKFSELPQVGVPLGDGLWLTATSKVTFNETLERSAVERHAGRKLPNGMEERDVGEFTLTYPADGVRPQAPSNRSRLVRMP